SLRALGLSSILSFRRGGRGCASRCCSRRCRLGPAAAVSAKNPRRRELTQLVTHHVFRHEQLGKLPAVVNQKRVSEEIRDDGAIPRPGLDRITMSRALLFFHLGKQLFIHIRAFFYRSTHEISAFRTQDPF